MSPLELTLIVLAIVAVLGCIVCMCSGSQSNAELSRTYFEQNQSRNNLDMIQRTRHNRTLTAATNITRSLPPTEVQSTDSTRQCVVCLEDIEVGQEAITTQCGHHFHANCIMQWWMNDDTVVKTLTIRCPVCKAAQQTERQLYDVEATLGAEEPTGSQDPEDLEVGRVRTTQSVDVKSVPSLPMIAEEEQRPPASTAPGRAVGRERTVKSVRIALPASPAGSSEPPRAEEEV